MKNPGTCMPSCCRARATKRISRFKCFQVRIPSGQNNNVLEYPLVAREFVYASRWHACWGLLRFSSAIRHRQSPNCIEASMGFRRVGGGSFSEVDEHGQRGCAFVFILSRLRKRAARFRKLESPDSGFWMQMRIPGYHRQRKT